MVKPMVSLPITIITGNLISTFFDLKARRHFRGISETRRTLKKPKTGRDPRGLRQPGDLSVHKFTARIEAAI